jgi:oxepin-CoA hydrolase/3-oxo-5,6-dehydrosuberyl-CoA semialdehyde dehydrogenase
VVKEMTVKCGQKCTAIRRIIVPDNLIEDVQKAISVRLDGIKIGHPTAAGVRMGALASKEQVLEVRSKIKELSITSEIMYGSLGEIELVKADFEKGAFLSPVLMLEQDPLNNTGVHEIEAFGPVSTLMPYKGLDEAIHLAQMGKGSLCCSLVSYDDNIAKHFVVESASHHGRILVLNRENAKLSTGHGSPLPTLVHGGPGRAGGGEEMGGIRGVMHYMQRCAVQGTPTTISEVSGIYQAGGKVTETTKHPFTYHFEDVETGMSLLTHKRTITDSDIQNFANLTWDVFYAHTDITSLEGSIFEKRAAHGYFLLAAAAGLFVYPNKGPVSANYGLEDCRFIRPIYHNDTIQVRLTCKEKINRDVRGKEHPAGIVKWLVEIMDEDQELVAMATILTLVQKKCPFFDFSFKAVEKRLKGLSPVTPALWGQMTAQHMVEHLILFYEWGLERDSFSINTPDDRIELHQNWLWNYKPMQQNFQLPQLRKGDVEDLRFTDLDTAKGELFKIMQEVEEILKLNPNTKFKNPTFGYLNKYEWKLLCRKHFHHHLSQFGLI